MAITSVADLHKAAVKLFKASGGLKAISDEGIADVEEIARQAAKEFAGILKKEVSSHADGSCAGGKMSDLAVNALSEIDISEPVLGEDSVCIDVDFSGDLHRESLVPGRYGGVENIAALLNNGYTAAHQVFGVWKGHGDDVIGSLTTRGGAHFVQQAKKTFMGSCASKYGVDDIEIPKIYE